MLTKELLTFDDGTVAIRGKCFVTGKEYTTAHFPRSEFDDWQAGGKHIQSACPSLNSGDREFLISSTSPEGWNIVFPPEERIVEFYDPHPGVGGCLEPLPELIKMLADEIAMQRSLPIRLALQALKDACPEGEWKVCEPNRLGLFDEIKPDGMICLTIDENGGYMKGGRTNFWRVLRFKDKVE